MMPVGTFVIHLGITDLVNKIKILHQFNKIISF
jgi:hypothetical protein